jgi:hypothetical protein
LGITCDTLLYCLDYPCGLKFLAICATPWLDKIPL